MQQPINTQVSAAPNFAASLQAVQDLMVAQNAASAQTQFAPVPQLLFELPKDSTDTVC